MDETELNQIIINELLPLIESSGFTFTVSEFFTNRVVEWAKSKNIGKEKLKSAVGNYDSVVKPIVDYFRDIYIPQHIIGKYVARERTVQGDTEFSEVKKEYLRSKIKESNGAMLKDDTLSELIDGLIDDVDYLKLEIYKLSDVLYSDEIRDNFFENTRRDVYRSCFNGYLEGKKRSVIQDMNDQAIDPERVSSEIEILLTKLTQNDCLCDYFRGLGLRMYQAGVTPSAFNTVYSKIVTKELLDRLVERQIDLLAIFIPKRLREKVNSRYGLVNLAKTDNGSEKAVPIVRDTLEIISETEVDITAIRMSVRLGAETIHLSFPKNQVLKGQLFLVREAVDEVLKGNGIMNSGDHAKVRKAIGRALSDSKKRAQQTYSPRSIMTPPTTKRRPKIWVNHSGNTPKKKSR